MPTDRVRDAAHTATLAELALVMGKARYDRRLTSEERRRAAMVGEALIGSALALGSFGAVVPLDQRVPLRGALLAIGRDVPVPQERLIEAHQLLRKLVQERLRFFTASGERRRP